MDTQLHETFSALGEPHRLAVVHLLRKEPRRPAELAIELSMSRPALSRHLRVLRNSGLVEEQSLDGDLRGRVYQLRREAFSQLQVWLTEMEAFWNTQLQAFKAHAESKASRRENKSRRTRK